MSLAYLGRRNLHTSPWTATRDALLAELWGQGYSATEIADQMSNVSRSAVLGRVRRLGLPAHKRGRRAQVTMKGKEKATWRPTAQR